MSSAEILEPLLAASETMDYHHPAVAAFIAEALGPAPEALDRREKAVRLYYAVRDRIRYDPYRFSMVKDNFKASHTVIEGAAYCVPKALLYAACLRAVGIPARPGFADVKNHLATERLLKVMGTDLFTWHGYVAVWLDGRWVKATPAFNLAMCERFGVLPLEFDGSEDSLMHPFNSTHQRHMEYVRQRGEFDDLPFDELVADMLATYPEAVRLAQGGTLGDFAREAIHKGSA